MDISTRSSAFCEKFSKNSGRRCVMIPYEVSDTYMRADASFRATTWKVKFTYTKKTF